jgi:1-deoxy-D-xylulose-5-phosphate synthase
MPGGTGLLKFRKEFPKRLFDVGIAEEHAVSMAGGLAKQGMVPVVALYSTFLQRSYDQIMQDVGLLGLHTVFAIDRAGLVGDDGETHHGTFDVGFLRQVPGMTVLCPVSMAEQQDMLRWAVKECTGPVAVRYPRGTDGAYTASNWQGFDAVRGAMKCHRKGEHVTLITYGTMLNNVMGAAALLAEQGIEATVLRLQSVAPLAVDCILSELSASGPVVVVEEVCTGSGIRETLAFEIRKHLPDRKVTGLDLGPDFAVQGDMQKLYRHYGLDAESIANYVREVVEHES